MAGIVEAVHRSAEYTFSKAKTDSIRLIEGLGVEGDVHSGTTVKHRSRVAIDPTQPNLRQAVLHLGATAAIRVTGLRNPCGQLNGLQAGLMKACITQDGAGNVTERRAGVMAVVVSGGEVRPGDAIVVELPDGSAEPLRPV